MRLLPALLLTLMPGVLLAASPLAGTWKLTGSYGRSSRPSIVKFEQDGDELRGTMLSYLGPRLALQEVSYQDGRVVFEVTRSRSGRTSSTRYEGVLRDGRIEGTTEFRRRGETRTDNWVTERT